MFAADDHQALADQLAGLKGRFLLTINDCPEARRVYGRFKTRSQRLHYGVGKGAKPVKELIVQGGGVV